MNISSAIKVLKSIVKLLFIVYKNVRGGLLDLLFESLGFMMEEGDIYPIDFFGWKEGLYIHTQDTHSSLCTIYCCSDKGSCLPISLSLSLL